MHGGHNVPRHGSISSKPPSAIDPHLARATSLHAGLTIAQLVAFGSHVVNSDHGHEAAVQAILALGWW
jgi:hypothetical protein